MAFKWIYSLRLGLRLNWRILLLVECILDARSLTQLKMQRQTKLIQHQLLTGLVSLEGADHRSSATG